MHKLLLIVFSFLFISCNFYVSDGNYDCVTKKTEIKDIAQCNDPIVITMPVYDELNLLGSKKLGTRYEQLGDIFVVIDTQTNDLFDWVYCPNEDGSVIWRCVEIGTNPKKYFSSCGSLQCCIQSGSTKVHQFKTDCWGRYMENFNTPGTKGLLIGYASDDDTDLIRYNIKTFDSETGNVSEDRYFLTDWVGYIEYPIADEYGNFYIADGTNGYSYIYKIPLNGNIEKLPFELSNNDKYYNHYILDIHENLILLTSYQLGVVSKDSDVYLLDLNQTDMTQNMKKIKCPPKYYDNTEYAFFFRGFYYKDSFYAILVYRDSFYIMKLNFETETLEDVSGLINFDMTENIWLRGTRVYFMCSRKLQNVSYMYFDLETKEKSEVFGLNFDEVIQR